MEEAKEKRCASFRKKRALLSSVEEDVDYWSHQVRMLSKKMTSFTQNNSHNDDNIKDFFSMLQVQLHEANARLKETRKYHLALIQAIQSNHSSDKEVKAVDDLDGVALSYQSLKKRKLSLSHPSDDTHGRWWNRVQTEYEILSQNALLPEGVICQEFQMEKSIGQCVGTFRCFIPFRLGSNALDLIPLIKLRISTPYRPGIEGDRIGGYPFATPEIKIEQGKIYLPSHCILKCSSSKEEEPFLILPILQNWQEAYTILNILEEFVSLVQENDPAPFQTSRTSSPSNTTAERIPQEYSIQSHRSSQEYSFTKENNTTPNCRRLRQSEVLGNMYTASELDGLGNLKEIAILLQDGSMFLLCPTIVIDRKSHGEDYFEVLEEITLQELENIKPHQDKSITFNFNDHTKISRTFFLREKDTFLQDLMGILSCSSETMPTDESSTSSFRPGSELFKDLLSFLPPKQAETTQKVVDKIGTYAEAIAKFWRGDT